MPNPTAAACRVGAGVQAVIAVGLAARLRDFTTPPEEVTGAIHLGVRIAIVLALAVAVLNLLAAAGAAPLGDLTLEVTAALYFGVATLTGIDQIDQSVDRQVANWAMFGGLGLLVLALRLAKRGEHR